MQADEMRGTGRRSLSFLPSGSPLWLSSFLLCASVSLWLALLFFYGLGKRDLWNSHEARAGMDARAVLDEGRWLVPRLHDGHPELQKPPLYYWCVASAGWIRGGHVDAWAVRLPAAVAGVGCLGVLTLLGWRRGRLAEG